MKPRHAELFGGPPGVIKGDYARLRRAGRSLPEEGATTCCYAQSENRWIADPQAVQWETFLRTGESAAYGKDSAPPEPRSGLLLGAGRLKFHGAAILHEAGLPQDRAQSGSSRSPGRRGVSLPMIGISSVHGQVAR